MPLGIKSFRRVLSREEDRKFRKIWSVGIFLLCYRYFATHQFVTLFQKDTEGDSSWKKRLSTSWLSKRGENKYFSDQFTLHIITLDFRFHFNNPCSTQHTIYNVQTVRFPFLQGFYGITCVLEAWNKKFTPTCESCRNQTISCYCGMKNYIEMMV